jgi:Spy/CpxP family protein refolding chaperone
MRTRARFWSWLLVLAVFAATPAIAHARGGPEQKRAEIQQRLKQLRHELLLKEVGLDAAKAASVERGLDKYAAERRSVRDRIEQHRSTLRKLLDANSNDQQAYTAAIRGLREAEKQRGTLRERELDEIGKLLTPKQQAQLMRGTERLKRRLAHRLRERRHGERD